MNPKIKTDGSVFWAALKVPTRSGQVLGSHCAFNTQISAAHEGGPPCFQEAGNMCRSRGLSPTLLALSDEVIE
jgi:hypothetical protein